ncbi:FAD-dependent monooxygenase [Streptomyces sp. W1SF4]|uniref:FAD-dependent monooxygenase n=1 Tax=Streptomyces sp. W1SF4 TaxID=2305220 RepID=UPI000F71657A|nr:FAD-dependent monooxygenase [Streptomyces sp. W1SF4]AZM93761.1 pyridine nucleotide-disulfide oxidoreductase [Streptomyces sp. W1SF4]
MSHTANSGRPTALVIGGSAAGLFAASVLAEFADVTLIERDTLPSGPEDRKGVPQARHAHLVWSGGVRAFEELLPGFVDGVVAEGGRLVPIMGDMVSRAPNEVWFRRFGGRGTGSGDGSGTTPHRILVCSRNLLDHVLRDHVLREHVLRDHVQRAPGTGRITVHEDSVVERLEGTATRVTGVTARIGTGTRTLTADLVVDASGRGSRAPAWLQALGLPAVTERQVDAGVAYATRTFRAPGTTGEGFPLVNVQASPAKAPGQGGIILPVEDGRWIVTLSGSRGGEPTKDPDAFASFALGLGDPVIGELIKDAEPLGDVVTTRSTANQRRYYEKMKDWPDGFVVLGDAVAGYNPVYGHGLTVAAQSALALRAVLADAGPTAPGAARRVQRAAARPVSAAWDLAVGQDACYPDAGATPPRAVERLLTRFVDRAVETAARSPRALGALLDVMSLEKPATRLFSPDVLVPMLFGPRKPHLQAPPLTDAERKAAAAPSQDPSSRLG